MTNAEKEKINARFAKINTVIFKFAYGTNNWVKPFMDNYLKETNPNKLAGLTPAFFVDKAFKEFKNYDTNHIKLILENERKLLESKGVEDAEKNTEIYWNYRAISLG